MEFKVKKTFKDRGVALLMVLASLALLSAVVVEFAYNSNVTYNLAMNDMDRVQAYYLAQSGINFSKLILKYDKEAQGMAKEASKKLGKNFQVQPLYQMIPINTELIRGLAGLSGEDGEEAEAEEEVPAQEEGGEQAGAEPSALEQGMNMIDSRAAEDFLDFNGDFSAEVKEEEAHLNLNAFFNLPPTDKGYDKLKSMLYHLLASDEFKGLFEDRFRGAQELAQSIADYIDKDDSHNDPGGEERGREVVRGQANAVMKNGKLLSLEELNMVPGMTEAVFQKLKDYVTLYGPDGKVWVCRAKDPLVRAMVIAYSENNPKMEPLKDDNEEMLKKATDAVLNNCPDLTVIAKELDLALGVTDAAPGAEGTETKPTGSTTTTSKEGQTTQGTSPQKSSSQSFTDLVKEKGTFFGVVGVGLVGESEVKVVTVIDTSQGDPKKWKQLYWRVE